MHARGKEKFIRIDVADASYEGLVKKRGLDSPAPLLQTVQESIELEPKRVRTLIGDGIRKSRKELKAAKLSHVIVQQKSIVQLQQRARVFARFGIPEQFARHPKMNIKDALIEIDKDLLACPAHSCDPGPIKTRDGHTEIAARDAMGTHFGTGNGMSEQMAPDRTDDRFNFREFGQARPRRLEPKTRLELVTYGLRNRCSTN